MTTQVTFSKPAGKVRLGYKKYLKLKRAQDVIEGLAWASVLAVTVMFLVDGGLKSVTDLPSGLNAVSRLTALVGTDLLLIHMLLIARIPWIDKFYGHDRATQAHKKLGKPVLYLVIAHFSASVISFSISAGVNPIEELVSLFINVPDMWSAIIGAFLMIAVVVTSLTFARRRMSYEAWYIVHIASYVAVLAAVPHQFSSGSDIHGYERKPFTQAQVTAIHFIDRVLGASRLALVGEVGYNHIGGIKDSPSELRFGRDPIFGSGEFSVPGACAALNAANPDECQGDGFFTSNSWGYRLRASADYSNVIAGINLTPSVAWSHDVDGFGPNFNEGSKAISIGLNADYQNTYTASLSYTDFFGGEYNTTTDRDFVALSFGVNF